MQTRTEPYRFRPTTAFACPNPVTVLTVAMDGILFLRLLVERVRAALQGREYEIIVVDCGSRDGSRAWLKAQPDVRVVTRRQWPWQSAHRHGEAAEAGARLAKHDRIVLLDSDSHPMNSSWLAESADRLDAQHRLAGAVFRPPPRQSAWLVCPSAFHDIL